MTPDVAVHGEVSVSKPGLPSFWPGLAQAPAATVQVNDAVPLAAPEVAVTVTDDVPGADGVPEIRPVDGLIDSPAGRPVDDHVYEPEPPEALICRLVVAPAVPDWLPGLATLTVV